MRDRTPKTLTQTPPSLPRWFLGFCTRLASLLVQKPVSTETSSVGFVPSSLVLGRVFLAIACLVGWLPLSGCSPAATSNVIQKRSPSEPSQQTPDVIVVGAGISGLSAALDLGR